MLREALVFGFELTLLGGCADPGSEQESPTPPIMTPAQPEPVHPLGDLLPIAIRLDCAKMGDAEPPAAVYVGIDAPLVIPAQTLIARIEKDDFCLEHDIASDPSAPALTIRCPPRQVMEYETGRYNCTSHDLRINVCSPGYTLQSEELVDYYSCGTKREQPSCGSLNEADATAYPYQTIVYELIPRPDGYGPCPYFDPAPATLLDDEPAFECPCFEE